jgi:hypothetical protein
MRRVVNVSKIQSGSRDRLPNEMSGSEKKEEVFDALLWRDFQNLVQATWTTQSPEPADSRKVHFWTRTVIVTVALAATTFGVLTMRR